MPEGAESLAVVGNGPITDANRADIEAAGSVIRFNEMNSWYPCPALSNTSLLGT